MDQSILSVHEDVLYFPQDALVESRTRILSDDSLWDRRLGAVNY